MTKLQTGNGLKMTKKKKIKVVRKRKTGFGLLNAAGTLIIVVIVALCLSVELPRLADISGYVVVSGSMEPAIPVGSYVYSRNCEPKTLKRGDVIVFSRASEDSIPVTHRVVENRTGEESIITKGDANPVEDFSPVAYENVMGKVILSVPYLGKLVSPLATLYGKLLYMGIVVFGFLLCELGRKEE